MLKVGLIGAGNMGKVRKNAYAQIEQVEVIAICDLKREKAAHLAEPGMEVAVDYREILQNPNIDVVDVCLPTHLHKAVVLAAAEAGKHVFCEKPISLTLEDAQEMIDACKKAGVKLGVSHVVRFHPDYSSAKDLLESGRLGEAKVVRTSRGGSFPAWSEDNWYADYSKSGGPILDLIIHDFDFLLWLFGPVRRVFAKTVQNRRDGDLDHVFVTLRFENGIIAHVEGSWGQPPGTPFTSSYEIAGTKGLYQYARDKSAPLALRTAENGRSKLEWQSPLVLDPCTAQLKAYLEAVRNDQTVPVSGEAALQALEVAVAAQSSAKTGEVVWLGGKIND